MLGLILCRFVLQDAGYSADIIDAINQSSLKKYLQQLANGDIIIQDQILSGCEFDSTIESNLQNIAAGLLSIMDDQKPND